MRGLKGGYFIRGARTWGSLRSVSRSDLRSGVFMEFLGYFLWGSPGVYRVCGSRKGGYHI